LKNTKKSIEEDDLKNPVVSFQTSFDFVRSDIERYRSQNMKYECFQVLHPWAYDLDQVDFKYVINKDQTQAICKAFKVPEARVFWLSYFKSQLAVSADEFISALREYCLMNLIPEHFEARFEHDYKLFMLSSDFAVSLAAHSTQITNFIMQAHQEANRRFGGRSLLNGDQVRFPGGGSRAKISSAQKNEYISEEKLAKSYKIGDTPYFDVMTLGQIKTWQLTEEQSRQKLDLRRITFDVLPNATQDSNLFLRFASVDTDELRDLEIRIEGN